VGGFASYFVLEITSSAANVLFHQNQKLYLFPEKVTLSVFESRLETDCGSYQKFDRYEASMNQQVSVATGSEGAIERNEYRCEASVDQKDDNFLHHDDSHRILSQRPISTETMRYG
jgi:hypothetical protein